MDYVIKQAGFNDIATMVDWAADEGWDPGLQDAVAFLPIDPYGFFMGYLNGQPIASISTLKYNDHFAFLGFYIVKPEYRHRNYGYPLWQHGINYLGTHNVGLDGVVEQQENYKKSNFKLAYTNIRYCFKGPTGNADSEYIKPVANVSLPLLLEYDRQFFPCDRRHFISHWLYMPNANAVVYDDGVIKGYGVIRECREGYKIGPLFADSADIAVIILQALCISLPTSQLIYIDIPEPNIAAHILIKKFRMKKNFLTARMYTQAIPDINLSSVFVNTTFEVG